MGRRCVETSLEAHLETQPRNHRRLEYQGFQIVRIRIDLRAIGIHSCEMCLVSCDHVLRIAEMENVEHDSPPGWRHPTHFFRKANVQIPDRSCPSDRAPWREECRAKDCEVRCGAKVIEWRS